MKVVGVSATGGYLGADLYSSAIVDVVTAGAVDENGRTTRAYAFALDRSGRLFGWGTNYHGVVDPLDKSGNTILRPMEISSGTAALRNALTLSSDKIAANMRILKKDGQIMTWGQNDAEHRAYGGYSDIETPDRAVLGGRALEVSGGVYNAVAVTTAGQVKTWGGTNDGTYDTRFANGVRDVMIYSGEQVMDEFGNLKTTDGYVQSVDRLGNLL